MKVRAPNHDCQILFYKSAKWHNCCVFWPANGCSAGHSLVEINLMLKQLFLSLTELNKEKRKESRIKTCNTHLNPSSCVSLILVLSAMINLCYLAHFSTECCTTQKVRRTPDKPSKITLIIFGTNLNGILSMFCRF